MVSSVSPAADTRGEARQILDQLHTVGTALAVKLYRLSPSAVSGPLLPCLDHEAMLHGGIPPHLAVYLQTPDGSLHDLTIVPAKRLLEIDTVSTWGECLPDAHRDLRATLARLFPTYRVAVRTPSWWRSDHRVVDACRAHVSLRHVLTADDIDRVKADVDRLQIVSSLMEKNSRVASWGVRTVTGPLLAAAGVITFQVLGALQDRLGASGVATLRSALVGLLGALFLYYGLKAVQLTDAANRVWKRSVEYQMILAERRRLAAGGVRR